MPVYEYECLSCKKVTEIWQGLSESPLNNCPVCQGNVKKIISMSSFALKGGGWYADGYTTPAPACKSGGCPASSASTGCAKSNGTSCSAS